MWEAAVKKHDEEVFEKGIEQGIEKRSAEIVERMISNGLSNSDIHKMTGIASSRIDRIRRRRKRAGS